MDDGNEMMKEAWSKRTTITLTTGKWKKVVKKQPIWVMVNKHIYEIKIEAVNRKKLIALMKQKKRLEKLIAKEMEQS